MTAFNPDIHKIVTASGQNLNSAAPVDGRVALARLLQTSGFADIKFGNSAPGDTSKLWHHDSQNTLKRWNPLTGGWSALTEGQFALWMHSKMVGSASPMPEVTQADRVMMQDVSSGEARYATVQSLMSAGGNLGSGLITKVAETKVTSPTFNVDVLNVTGAKIYLVRTIGLTLQSPPTHREDFYMQLGNSSGWFDNSGDYYDPAVPHLQLTAQPVNSPAFDYMYAGDILDDRIFSGLFVLKFMNDPNERTAIHELKGDITQLLAIEEEVSQINEGVEAEIRTAATAEDRLRFSCESDAPFVAGRIQVYAIGA
ncbi:hypothetical protein T8A63_15280 [Sulfitobacter sp. OXR-159]|uniref:hypothetical protein n=1 Tax=Sulfitobacter sp. OXR-159 TaxID=3100174 RepID=UPI002AC90ED6|nr:hypothetical protein [Sulfitobacter sp. OXR-159]WPZ28976.1 hypothetical protein T8A63_15280 [Sulfitobacter sp. OXR-159]